MNEQERADLLSEQIDRMLQGEPLDALSDADDVSSLLDLVQPLAEATFQPSTANQATFQNQLQNWNGPTDGGSSMTLFGLSQFWSICITIVTVVVIGLLKFFASLYQNES